MSDSEKEIVYLSESQIKKKKAQDLVDSNRERRARACKTGKKKATNMIIDKDRGIRAEPLTARTDPEVRKKQIEDKAAEEIRRVEKINAQKLHKAKVQAKKAKAAADRAASREKTLSVAAGDPKPTATQTKSTARKANATKKAAKKKGK